MVGEFHFALDFGKICRAAGLCCKLNCLPCTPLRNRDVALLVGRHMHCGDRMADVYVGDRRRSAHAAAIKWQQQDDEPRRVLPMSHHCLISLTNRKPTLLLRYLSSKRLRALTLTRPGFVNHEPPRRPRSAQPA